MEDMPFEKIKDRVRQDWGPIKPFAPPWKRSAFLFGVWLILAALNLTLFGPRPDADVLGPWYFWILPIVQLLSAYAVIVLGVRLTVPGSAAAPSVVAGLAFLGAAVHLAVSWMIFQISPVEVEAGRHILISLVCLVFTLSLSILPLVLALVMSRRGMPSRPAVVGLACGFACGLSAEAVWRMHCPYSSWSHILSSHTAAVLAAVLLGWILSLVFFRHYGKRQSKPE